MSYSILLMDEGNETIASLESTSYQKILEYGKYMKEYLDIKYEPKGK